MILINIKFIKYFKSGLYGYLILTKILLIFVKYVEIYKMYSSVLLRSIYLEFKKNI